MPSHTHFEAKVKRIYVNENGANIRLKGKGEGYFKLSKNHSQYNALYSLALVAAVNDYTLLIRVVGEREGVTNQNADVSYMVIDW